jgi:hypothetical protein
MTQPLPRTALPFLTSAPSSAPSTPPLVRGGGGGGGGGGARTAAAAAPAPAPVAAPEAAPADDLFAALNEFEERDALLEDYLDQLDQHLPAPTQA